MPYRFISNRAGAAPYHNGRMREKKPLLLPIMPNASNSGSVPKPSITRNPVLQHVSLIGAAATY